MFRYEGNRIGRRQAAKYEDVDQQEIEQDAIHGGDITLASKHWRPSPRKLGARFLLGDGLTLYPMDATMTNKKQATCPNNAGKS